MAQQKKQKSRPGGQAKTRKKYVKPTCKSEESFGSLILGCSFTDCGENSAFK